MTSHARRAALRLDYKRHILAHFGVCSSGFSLSFAPVEVITRITIAKPRLTSDPQYVIVHPLICQHGIVLGGAMSDENYNILYIHSHDSGRYIQPYGYAIPTPALQELAQQGVLFRQAFTVNPTCSPSRAALLTGEYPHQNGMLGLAHRGFALYDYRKHIIHTLKTRGYTAALAGVQHIASGEASHRTIGYDRLLKSPAGAHQAAAEFLMHKPAEPFFLSVGFMETHRKGADKDFFRDDEPLDARYTRPPEPLPDTPETRMDMANYAASAMTLDRKMGAVLDALKTSGMDKRTIIVCTTDHGIAFPRMKCNLEDSGTGVMLIVKAPEDFQGGQVVNAMVSHLDLYPTLCDMLGIDKPTRLQGKSLLPLVRGESAAIHEDLYFTVNYHASYEPLRAVRTERWKYIKRFTKRNRPSLPNCDDSHSKQYWLDQGWRSRPQDEEMLYDLTFDPHETNNLVADSRTRDVLADMRARMDRYMRETDDPLLNGDIPLPPTAICNDPDGLQPHEEPLTQGQREKVSSGFVSE
jgi:N-sulfoglucosamine sulfohydrolase